MKFRTTLELGGKTATGMAVPAAETRPRRITKSVEMFRNGMS